MIRFDYMLGLGPEFVTPATRKPVIEMDDESGNVPNDVLVTLLREHWATLHNALGDAVAFRLDMSDRVQNDVELAERYRAAADALGMALP